MAQFQSEKTPSHVLITGTFKVRFKFLILLLKLKSALDNAKDGKPQAITREKKRSESRSPSRKIGGMRRLV